MDLGNIYLISNDIELDEAKINELTISSNDLIVLFNHARPIQFSKIKNHSNKWLFLRTGHTVAGYWGYKEAIRYCLSFKRLVFIEKKIEGINLISKYNPNYSLIEWQDYSNKYDYPFGMCPTSGFISFIFFRENYNTKIFLINFTGKGSDGTRGWHLHDYKFEQKYYKDNNITII